jgi:broad specificity phosphatase PhoE
MRVLEHRRHSRRDPSGVHLNVEGLALAQRVRREIGSFDRVLTSPRPRAVETAEALGFPHPEVVPALADVPEDVGLTPGEAVPTSFSGYLDRVTSSRSAREFANLQASLWAEALSSLPEGGRLLMISHGGIIEFGACGALPRAVASWGPPVGYLEGVRLEWNHSRWTGGQVLRVGTASLSR